MKHVYAILIKFAMITIVLEIVLMMLTNLTFTDIIYISFVVTTAAYVIGDLIVLSASNNTIATIADIGLAAVTIYMFNYLWSIRTISITDSLIAAVVIGVGEWFFHKYVANNVFPEHKEA